jgi:hypothetical protein
MTKSVRSVNVLVRIDLEGHDLSNNVIEDVINNMEYSFVYEDDYATIMNTEIIDSFVPDPN